MKLPVVHCQVAAGSLRTSGRCGGVRGLLNLAGGFLFVEVVEILLGVRVFECDLPSRYVHES